MEHEKMKAVFKTVSKKLKASLQEENLTDLPENVKFEVKMLHPSGAEFKACFRHCTDKHGVFGLHLCKECID